MENALFLRFHHKMSLKGRPKGQPKGRPKGRPKGHAFRSRFGRKRSSDCQVWPWLLEPQAKIESKRADRTNTQAEHGQVGLATSTSKSHVI